MVHQSEGRWTALTYCTSNFAQHSCHVSTVDHWARQRTSCPFGTAEWPSTPRATWQDPPATSWYQRTSRRSSSSQPPQDQLPTPTDGRNSLFLLSRPPYLYTVRTI